MKISARRAFTALRDALSGRRRLAGYSHPDAHRAGRNRDADIVGHYIPLTGRNQGGGTG